MRIKVAGQKAKGTVFKKLRSTTKDQLIFQQKKNPKSEVPPSLLKRHDSE